MAVPRRSADMPRSIILTLFLLALCACNERRFQVPTGAMEPTITDGGYVWVDMNAFDSKPPAMWDLVVFEAPQKALDPRMAPKKLPKYIMRVIGIPGDTLDYGDNVILRNGEPLILPPEAKSANLIGLGAVLGSNHLTTFKKSGRSLVIPKDHVFVVGDNGITSYDSRFWGPLHVSKIVGEVTTIE